MKELRQSKWGGIYYCEVCPPEQYSSTTILGNRWTLPTGMKLRINIWFFFASASGLWFCFIKLFLFWPMGFFQSCFYPHPAEEGSEKSGMIGHPASVRGQATTPHYSSTGSLSFWKSSHFVHSRRQYSSLRLLWFLLYEKDKNDPVAKFFFFCKSSEPLSWFLDEPLIRWSDFYQLTLFPRQPLSWQATSLQ